MTDNEKKILFGFGLLGIGVFLFMKRKMLSGLASSALDEVNEWAFTASLPARAQPYSAVIRQVAREQSIDPFLLVALVQREDPMWNPAIVSPDGGYGLAQITSDRAWIATANWSDPHENLTRGAQMLNDELTFFRQKLPDDPDLATQAALAAYNHGRGAVWTNLQARPRRPPDTGTTGNDYATAVWNTLAELSENFRARLAGGFAGWQDAGVGRRGPGGQGGLPQV